MAISYNLDSMTYGSNPGPLIQLREELKKSGYFEAERKITASIERRKNELNPNKFFSYLNFILFDLTCEYGVNKGKPIALVFLFVFIFYKIYLLLYLSDRLDVHIIPMIKNKEETSILITPSRMMFLSLISAFSIGVGQFNLNDWVKRVLKKEYQIDANGLTRTLIGLQSLVSLYLVSLTILIFFGDPFNQ
jgi:hypothetical protein